MAAFRLLLMCCVFLVFPLYSDSIPEPGKLKMTFSKDVVYRGFSKALYKGATISVKGTCKTSENNPPMITIRWKLKYTQCADFFLGFKDINTLWLGYRKYELHGEDTVPCKSPIKLTDQSSQTEYIYLNKTKKAAASKPPKTVNSPDKETKGKKKTEEIKSNTDKKEASSERVEEKSKPPKSEILISNKKKSNIKKENASQRNKRVAEFQDEESKPLFRVKRANDDEEDGDNNGIEKEEDNNDNTNNASKDADKKPPLKPNQKSKKTAKLNKETTGKSKDGKTVPAKVESPESKTKTKNGVHPLSNKGSNTIVSTRRDGIYMLIVNVESDDDTMHLELDVSMESKSGYLSATDWPLLPFYGVMSLLYLFYGIVWLIVSACQWRDLLRIQFWIGGVIALGMLEKAVFYSEYNNINHTGIPTPSLVVFAEIVSVAKRTLARMLVIIVSMGFGIVKPRLGKSLHRVLGVGALYFIVGVVEGCLRSLRVKADPSKEQLVAGIPLAVLDAAICWWIFMSLVQTTRTLRIRRNVIKLSLYRHFTNTLIFAVLASVAYMIWSIKTHKFAECIKDWSELWLDEAFWHFLFSIILLVIMVLWRPTANNQRYAFTPIVDFDDDEEDNVTLSEAFDGMKMRNTRTEVVVNGDSKKKAEDDLKWVEENIPSSAADTVLPSVLDSDEELMTTKFEMSKMD